MAPSAFLPSIDPDGAPIDLDSIAITKDALLHWYHQMVQIRRVEELAAKAYTQRKILGFCHLYIGQEAVVVGANAALRDVDVMVTAYRDHGHALARGVSARAVLAELFGKGAGVTKGIGGSMHMGSAEHNLFGGFGIVGGHVPLAVGAAFASQYQKQDKVALVFYGDGAAQQGAVFEAMALAQLWKLPTVFLCENNYYAMGTRLDRYSHLTDMSRRADGVGMKRWQFAAYDVVDVYRNMVRAVEFAREGKGPVALEAVTYRYRGHSMSDPAKYRADGELDAYKGVDGIESAATRLTTEFGVSDDELNAVRDRVEEEAQDAYAFADSAAEPPLEALYDYTYAPTPEVN